jgi:hypothetical protein
MPRVAHTWVAPAHCCQLGVVLCSGVCSTESVSARATRETKNWQGMPSVPRVVHDAGYATVIGLQIAGCVHNLLMFKLQAAYLAKSPLFVTGHSLRGCRCMPCKQALVQQTGDKLSPVYCQWNRASEMAPRGGPQVVGASSTMIFGPFTAASPLQYPVMPMLLLPGLGPWQVASGNSCQLWHCPGCSYNWQSHS